MIITAIGFLTLALGGWLYLKGSTGDLVALLLMTSLMNGSAAFIIGGSLNIQPIYVALAILCLRAAMTDPTDRFGIPDAILGNGALWIYVIYGVIAAIILPRLFMGAFDVVPLNFDPKAGLFATIPLAPTAQNASTAFYLVGTAVAATAMFHAMGRENGRNPARIARWASIVAITQASIGFVGLATKGTPLDVVISFFRNAHYAQLDQSFGTISRMSGIAPEPSAYAGVALPWFFVCSELWLREIDPRWSGAATGMIGAALLASTSSTAYVGLALYTVIVAARLLLAPGQIAQSRVLIFLTIAGIAVAAGLALSIANPAFVARLQGILEGATFGKATSVSGQQRLFWTMQGLHAFVETYGLGIGPGSFRSSSLLAAIVGSSGLIGTIAFLYYEFSVLNPITTIQKHSDDAFSRLARAFATAGALAIVPATLTGSTADPGVIWGLICGAALGIRKSMDVSKKAPSRLRKMPGNPVRKTEPF